MATYFFGCDRRYTAVYVTYTYDKKCGPGYIFNDLFDVCSGASSTSSRKRRDIPWISAPAVILARSFQMCLRSLYSTAEEEAFKRTAEIGFLFTDVSMTGDINCIHLAKGAR